MKSVLRVSLALALLASSASPAWSAGLFRAYLSVKGDDLNSCTVQAPCRLLPAALDAVADGGEIWIMDSANFNTSQVNIGKSVTILAIPGAVGSLVSTGGGNAIYVNAAGAKVALRNLVIVRIGTGNDGVGFNGGDSLTVEDCEIANMSASAISAYDTAAKVTVKNTVLRSNNIGFYARGPVVASLDGVHSDGNTTAGVYLDSGAGTGPTVGITNSFLRHNQEGVYSTGSGTIVLDGVHSEGNVDAGVLIASGTRLTATNSQFSGNFTGVVIPAATATLDAVRIENNVSDGLRVVGGSATASRSIFAYNNRGIFADNAARLDVSGSTLTNNAASGATVANTAATQVTYLTLSNSTIGGNHVGVETTTALPLTQIVLDANTITGNVTGASGIGGTLISTGNNIYFMNEASPPLFTPFVKM